MLWFDMSGSEPLTVEPLSRSKHWELTAAITPRNASAERSEGKKIKKQENSDSQMNLNEHVQ